MVPNFGDVHKKNINMVNTPWFVRNKDIYRDLNIPLDKIKLVDRYGGKVHHHVIAQVIQSRPQCASWVFFFFF